MLGFTLALSILTGILFGLVPALQSSRADLSSALKESSNRSGTGLRHNRTRALLVTTEMALALVLLIGAALLIRTFIAIRQVNPGFDAHNVLTMRLSLTGPQFENPASVTQAIDEGVRRITRASGRRGRGNHLLPASGATRVPADSRLRDVPTGRLLEVLRSRRWFRQATSRPSRFRSCVAAHLRNRTKAGRRRSLSMRRWRNSSGRIAIP